MGSVSDAYGTPLGSALAALAALVTPLTSALADLVGSGRTCPTGTGAIVTPLAGTSRIFGIITFRDSAPAALAASDAPLCGVTATPALDGSLRGAAIAVTLAASDAPLCGVTIAPAFDDALCGGATARLLSSDAPHAVSKIAALKTAASIFITVTVRATRRAFRPGKRRRAPHTARER